MLVRLQKALLELTVVESTDVQCRHADNLQQAARTLKAVMLSRGRPPPEDASDQFKYTQC